jgi:hypothetical protein
LFQIFLHTCEGVASRLARMCTELYRALRRSRQPVPTLDETAVETMRKETAVSFYDPSWTLLERLLLPVVPTAEMQQELMEVALAFDPCALRAPCHAQ